MSSYEPQPPSILYPNAAVAEEALKDFALQNGFDLIIAERYPRGSGENCTRLTFRCVRGRAVKAKPAASTTSTPTPASTTSTPTNTTITAASVSSPASAVAANATAVTTSGDEEEGVGSTPAKKRRRARSQMTGCPYRINIKMQKYEGFGWRIDRVHHRGSAGPGLLQGHNHDLCLPTAFSTFRHRNLRRHEVRILELYRQGCKPREILAQLERDIEERRMQGPGEGVDDLEADYHGQGVGFSYQDLQNLLQRKKRDGVLSDDTEPAGFGDWAHGADPGGAELADGANNGGNEVSEDSKHQKIPAVTPTGGVSK